MKYQSGKSLLTPWFLAVAALAPACQPGAFELDSQQSAVLGGGQLNGGGLPNKSVVLTYDDGPDEHTLELAQYLAEQGVKATFFINGSRLCKAMAADGTCMTPPDTRPCNNGVMQAKVDKPKFYPESLLDQMLALGHRLGNHTQDHCHLPGQTNAMDLAWELQTTQTILDRHVCDDVKIFRAPFGEWDGTVAGRLNSQMGFNAFIGPVNWDVDGNDWDCWRNGAAPAQCADKYIGILNGKGKGIFLMHDRPEFNVGSPNPLLMTQVLIPKLKAAGYRFATLDEALKLSPKDAGTCQMPPVVKDAGAETAAPVDAGGTGGATGTGGSGGAGSGGAGSGGSGSGGAGGAGSGGSGSGGSSVSTGGAPSSSGSGGRSGTGGSSGESPPAPVTSDNGGGIGCSYAPAPARGPAAGLLLMLGFVVAGFRRRKR